MHWVAMDLTLIPSNRDKALRGLRARKVLRDLMGPKSEYPSALAIRLTIETYTEGKRKRQGDKDRAKVLKSGRMWEGQRERERSLRCYYTGGVRDT